MKGQANNTKSSLIAGFWEPIIACCWLLLGGLGRLWEG